MRASLLCVAAVMVLATVLVAVACNKQAAAPPSPRAAAAAAVDAAPAAAERVPDAAVPVVAKPSGPAGTWIPAGAAVTRGVRR